MDKDEDVFGGGDTEEKDTEEDKTSEDKNEDEDKDKTAGDDGEKKSIKSDIAQKIKYRERAKAAESKIQTLQDELAELRGMVKKPAEGDDAEARAQKYIRDQAKAVFDELQKAKKSEEEKLTQKLQSEVEEILDENPDIAEQELLDACEEYEVEPKVALKILKKSTTSKPKPKMPQNKRASTGVDDSKLPDDKGKSMWDIVREETAKLK